MAARIVPRNAVGVNGKCDVTIVCGVEATSRSRAALRVAARLGEHLRGRLVVVNVREPLVPSGASLVRGARKELYELARRGAERVLRRMTAECEVPVVLRPAVGDPAACLAAVAAEERAALIVLGSRARRPLAAALLGSVSTALCREAPCPVLVVPPRAAHRSADTGRASLACDAPQRGSTSAAGRQRLGVAVGADGRERG